MPDVPSYVNRLRAALPPRYDIHRELGHGGMGTVFLASDREEDRSVALKVLSPATTLRVARERFLREIDVSAGLRHPHIVHTIDWGEAGGFLYYVMPYLEGPCLRDRLREEKRLAVDEALLIVREVADALAFAHSSGVLHRDVKPENIVFEAKRAMIADFGAAVVMTAALDERLTQPGEALGTPMYMSPEQAMGRRTLTARSDLYSLACVLYELLSGEPPFRPKNPRAIIVRRIDQSPPRIGRTRPEVPKGVEAAIVKGLEWHPKNRFPSMSEFAGQLDSPGR